MIEKLYVEINKVTAQLPNYDFIYLFINDGSKDRTLELVKEKSKN